MCELDLTTTQAPTGVQGFALSPWLIAGLVSLTILAAVGYVIYRSKNRKKAALIAGIALAWALGLGFAFAQLVPGLPEKLPAPIGSEGQSADRTMTLEEAQRQVPFQILVPSYLPVRIDEQGRRWIDFELENVRLEQGNRGADALVVVTYFNDRANSEIQIWEQPSNGRRIDLGESNLQIGNSYAKVAQDGDRTDITWESNGTWVELSGEYGKLEIIKTAKSMR